MIEVSAVVNGLEIVASGMFHVFSDTIHAKVSGMNMLIRFKSDSESSETRFYTELDGNTLVLNLENFSAPFPEGQFEPRPVGTVDGRSLFMAFTVSTLNKAKDARIFSYTFYLDAGKS